MGRKVRINFSLDNGHSLDDFPVDLYSGLTSGDTSNLVFANIVESDIPFEIEFEDSDLVVNTDPQYPSHPYCYMRISSEGCMEKIIKLEVPRFDCEMCAEFIELMPPPTAVPPTSTPQPTSTPAPTSVPPTATPLPTPGPTSTPAPTAPPPTATPQPTSTPAPTAPPPTATPQPTSTPAPTAPPPTATPQPTGFDTNITLTGNYGVQAYSNIQYSASFSSTSVGARTLTAGPSSSCLTGCSNSGVLRNVNEGDTLYVSVARVQPDQIATDSGSISLVVTGPGTVNGLNPTIFNQGDTLNNIGWSITGADSSTELEVVVYEG